MENKNLLESHSLTIVNIVKSTFNLAFSKPLFLLVPFLILGAIGSLFSLFIFNYEMMSNAVYSGGFGNTLFYLAWLVMIVGFFLLVLVSTLTVIATYKLVKGEKLDRKHLLSQLQKKYGGILLITVLQSAVILIPFMLFAVLSIIIPVLGFFLAIVLLVFGFIAFVRIIFADYFFLFEGKTVKESCYESNKFVLSLGGWSVFWKFVGIGVALLLISLLWYAVLAPFFSSLFFASGFASGTLFLSFLGALIKGLFYAFFSIAWTLAFLFYKTKEHGHNEQEKEKLGCFFYGCMGSLIILILGTSSLIFFANKFFKYAVKNYTTEQRMQLPEVSLNTGDLLVSAAKIKTLNHMVNFNSGDSITLTEKDLNAMVYALNSGNQFTGENFLDYLTFKVQSGELYAYFSLPLYKLQLQSFSGKYVNGYVGLSIGSGGYYPVVVTLFTGELNGQAFPENVMQQFIYTNLMQGVYQRSYQYPWINNIKSAAINKNNEVVVEVFGEQPDDALSGSIVY